MDKQILIDYLNWVDNKTYILDNSRYWCSTNTLADDNDLATSFLKTFE